MEMFLFSDSSLDAVKILGDKCIRCHGGEKTKASFDMKTMLSRGIDPLDISIWNKVYRVIESGDMPPEDEDEFLTVEQEDLVLSHLEKELITNKNITRLITADEILNTLSDLFGIDLENDNQFETLKGYQSLDGFSTQQKDKSMSLFYLNEINRLFDTIGEQYIFPLPSSYSIELDKAVSLKLNTVGFASASFVYQGSDYTDLRGQYQDHPTAFRRTDIKAPELNLSPGKYRLSLKVSSHQRKKISGILKEYSQGNKLLKEPAKLSFYLLPKYNKSRPGSKGKEKWIKSVYLDDHNMNEIEVEIDIHQETAIGFAFENGPTGKIIKRFFGNNFSYDKKIPPSPAEYPYPYLRFHEIKLLKIKQYSHEFCNVNSRYASAYLEEAMMMIEKLGVNMNSSTLESIFIQQFSHHKNIQLAYLNTLKAILLSSDFLYLEFNPEIKQSRYASYALLKSMPTKEFDGVYRKYKLAEISAEQFTNWIIQQPSFKRFTDQFTHEWLDLDEINMNQPDEIQFKAFYQDKLQAAFDVETKSFIKNLFVENLSVKHLVDSEVSFQNNSLKHYYDLPLHPQAGYYRSKVDSDVLRKGLIFQGSFLAATSNGVEDLPFRRAKWISENILDRAIPAPPDNIDIEAFEETNGTFLEKMKAHRNNELCSSCHKLIDPWAEKMRYFDAIGQFKNKFKSEKVNKELVEMKEELLRKSKSTATAFCRNLVAFTTGRINDIKDLKNIQHIVEENRENGYRVRDLYTSMIKTYF